MEAEENNKIKSKYPIVLVHGMMVKDFKFYRAFRKITDFLRKNGLTVYVLNHDGIGTIQNNAMQMKIEINNILEKEQVDKVNIIAHSKGGLDSRYMISKLDMSQSVATLTTLSTPHHGSKMCRVLLKMPRFLQHIISFFLNVFYKIFGDQNPDFLTLANELTDTYMKEFNEEVKNSENVYYQSFSSNIDKRKMFFSYLPYKFSVYCEKESTDGIVSLSSSKWGVYQGNIDGDFNHSEMIALYGSKKRIKRVSQFYYDIIIALIEKGY